METFTKLFGCFVGSGATAEAKHPLLKCFIAAKVAALNVCSGPIGAQVATARVFTRLSAPGALFVLVIALRFDVFWIGALAVVTMGLGTAAFNLLVAWSGVAARRLSAVQAMAEDDIQRVSATVQIAGGGIILLASVVWLMSFWA